MCAKCVKRIRDPYNSIDTEPPPAKEAPPFCPMRLKPELIDKATAEYERNDIMDWAVGSNS